VLPLLTKADGSKYGKTATGTVWLDPQRTSPYRFYQFFVNSEDIAVGALLKSLTFLPQSDIAALEQATSAEPESRAAQKALAREMTVLVHGKDAFDGAVRASEILFGGPLDGVNDATFHDVVGEVPTTTIAAAQLAGDGLPVANALVAAGLSASRSQARRDIEAGGVYLNNIRITEVSRAASMNDLLFGQFLLLRKGRRSYAVIRVE
jgi:tyrosyl-tRNA synthetase